MGRLGHAPHVLRLTTAPMPMPTPKPYLPLDKTSVE
jgi:hypothetical protein